MRSLLPIAVLVLLAGCLGTSGGPPVAIPETAQPVASPEAAVILTADNTTDPHHWEGEFRAQAMTAVCAEAASAGCTAYVHEASTPVFLLRLREDDPAVAGATRFVVAASWTASTETAKVIHLRLVAEESGEVMGHAKGVSPLSFEVPKDALGLAGSYRVEVDPDTGGLFLDQSVQVTMDLL